MEEDKRIEDLGDRLFSQSVGSIFGYEFEKEIANTKERYAHQNTLRSSSFAWAVADQILGGLQRMREAFLESYLPLIEETQTGLTDDRFAWLRSKLERVWEQELVEAKARLCGICEGIGLPSRDVQPQVGKVEIEGRKTKLAVLGDLDIARLRREHSTQPSGSPLRPKPLEDFSFVQDSRIRSILARDHTELGTLDSTIQSKAVLILSGGIIEGVLLDALVIAGKWGLEEGSRRTLKEIIDASLKLGVTRQDRLSHAAREYRDLVHPGREVREGVTFTSDDANVARAAVGITIREVKEWHAKRSKP